MIRTLALLLGALLLSAGYLLATPTGSRDLAEFLLAQYGRARHVDIQRIRGTWVQGLTLNHVVLPHPVRPAVRQRPDVMIEELTLAPFTALLTRDVRFEARGVHVRAPWWIRDWSAAEAHGRLFGPVVFRDVRLAGLARGAASGEIVAQRVDAVWPLSIPHVRAIHNGQLRLTYSEPILFSGQQTEQGMEARVYARRVDVEEVLRLILDEPVARPVKGILSEAALELKGAPFAPTIDGQIRIASLSRGPFAMAECPVTAHVTIETWLPKPRLRGTLSCFGGSVTAKDTTVALQHSTLAFAGDPLNPAFDVVGRSTIAGTLIRATVRGTRTEPVLHLSSDPPLPEGALLVMLATGRAWKGAQEVVSVGTISSDLATDFIDYFVFGGLGGRLARRLGISDLSIHRDMQSNRVGVETTLADRVELGVEVQPTPAPDDSPAASSAPQRTAPWPYRVEAEYKMTHETSLTIEGERTLIDPRAPTDQSSQTTATDPTTETDDRVLMKLKKRF